MIFLVGFGRGKPVQINPSYYKKPLRDELIVALAGPTMNILLASLGMLFLMIYAKIIGISASALMMYQFDFVTLFFFMFITVNLALAVFNMIPLPPLDGFRLAKVFLPKIAAWMQKNAQYIFIALVATIIIGNNLGNGGIIGNYIATVSDFFYRILFSLFSLIFY